ncbi:cyclase family protein [Galbibacter sp. CMA-7]|uniref:Cyclase family protein n=1 Tax=Galbibacter pacificus TaxID=2996052 RepID=A0ABT6FSH6_9FLAO|nr:cyclase family protein [Galbibacter pacificus]MDG3582665.1 cyclase family protein [Galbibacter pacificus]MDG3586216.1 cyclase family protein [Galbibacter pacificus]
MIKTTIEINQDTYTIDVSKPIDVSIPLRGEKSNPTAWYVGPPEIAPVTDGNFTGSVASGASTNFNNIFFNPHAHGTHTECIGHITKEFHSINDCLTRFFFLAELISVTPEETNGDRVITKKMIENALKNNSPEAVLIRTLPNSEEKLTHQYSHTNPPYLLEETALFLREKGIKHLLIDLPSVDKEKDEGKLLAHKAFWNFNKKQRLDATITEFIFVPDHVVDGTFFLNLQIASFVNDASPSKPILYKIIEK